MSVEFGGVTIKKPGSYSIVTREDASPVSYGSAQVLAFIGVSTDVASTSTAAKDKVLWYNDRLAAKKALVSGKLLDMMSIAWQPTKEVNAYGADLIAVVIASDSTIAGYTKALSLLRKENIQGVVPMSIDPAVQALVKDHCTEMSGVKLRKERRAFLGTMKLSVIAGNTGGTGATATCEVVDGAITNVTVTAGGSGYLIPPTVTVEGLGTGATLTATVANGVVTGITITAPGSGYTEAPTLAFVYTDGRDEATKINDYITQITTALGDGRTCVCAGGINKYIDGSLVTTDGVGFAAAVAGMWAGKTTTVDPVTFDELDVVGLDYELEDVDPALDAFAVVAEKVFVENRKPIYRVVNAQTGVGSDLSVETTIDEMNKTLRREMEVAFVGKVTGDPASVETSKYNKFITLLNRFVKQGYLVESIDPNTGEKLPPYKDVKMVKTGKVTTFTWWGKVIEPDNYILIDSHIAVSSN